MEEILLGIDYGATNTGLAFGRAGLASPLSIVNSKDEATLTSEIVRVVADNKITKIVMGLPRNIEQKETGQSLRTRRFAKVLKIRLKLPVVFIDEYGTSKEALGGAIKTGISKKRRKTNDHLSAALILKRYYNEQADLIQE